MANWLFWVTVSWFGLLRAGDRARELRYVAPAVALLATLGACFCCLRELD